MTTRSANRTEQERWKAFVARRHPEYEGLLPHWQFLEATYEGGPVWFGENIFQYIKEGDEEFANRVARAYRFNHTREVVDLVDKYLFKMDVVRKEDAPEPIKAFWKRATLDGLSIDDYVRQISKQTSIHGRMYVVVDSTGAESVTTVADAKKADIRAYSYLVKPQHALDMSHDAAGELNWILIYEEHRDDADPIDSSGEMESRYRLWEREQWTLFRAIKDGKGKITIVKEGPYLHEFGAVPVFAADHLINNERYDAPSLIDDIAYLDRAVANYLSNLDAIIQDQTFSQLIMPAQGLLPGDDKYQKLLEMGTKRIFTYDAEHGGKPEFISPDIKQAQLVMQVINKIINEIYHTSGLAGERTKEDNAVGIDNSSGVAKAYDFERVNSLLVAKGDSLDRIENKLVEFVARWMGIKLPEKMVAYPPNYDVRGLYDEFEIATKLQLLEAPDEVRREQMGTLIAKLFPKMRDDLIAKMKAAVKTWPPKIDPLTGESSGLVKPAKKPAKQE